MRFDPCWLLAQTRQSMNQAARVLKQPTCGQQKGSLHSAHGGRDMLQRRHWMAPFVIQVDCVECTPGILRRCDCPAGGENRVRKISRKPKATQWLAGCWLAGWLGWLAVDVMNGDVLRRLVSRVLLTCSNTTHAPTSTPAAVDLDSGPPSGM